MMSLNILNWFMVELTDILLIDKRKRGLHRKDD